MLCFILVSAGCSKGLRTQYVVGVVTLDGIPLPGAFVTFQPVDAAGGLAAGGISDENGMYKLTSLYGKGEAGAVEAEYIVLVSKTEDEPLPKPIRYEDGTVTTTMSRHVLSPAYLDMKTSPLRFQVRRGKNTINIELETGI